MHPIAIVLDKEFRDARRDKRSVMSAFLFPVFAPVMVYFMLTAIIELRANALKITIPIQGGEHAPGLIQWLEEKDVSIEDFAGDARAVVREKDKDVIIIIPDNYQQRLAELRSIEIEVHHLSSQIQGTPGFYRDPTTGESKRGSCLHKPVFNFKPGGEAR